MALGVVDPRERESESPVSVRGQGAGVDEWCDPVRGVVAARVRVATGTPRREGLATGGGHRAAGGGPRRDGVAHRVRTRVGARAVEERPLESGVDVVAVARGVAVVGLPADVHRELVVDGDLGQRDARASDGPCRGDRLTGRAVDDDSRRHDHGGALVDRAEVAQQCRAVRGDRGLRVHALGQARRRQALEPRVGQSDLEGDVVHRLVTGCGRVVVDVDAPGGCQGVARLDGLGKIVRPLPDELVHRGSRCRDHQGERREQPEQRRQHDAALPSAPPRPASLRIPPRPTDLARAPLYSLRNLHLCPHRGVGRKTPGGIIRRRVSHQQVNPKKSPSDSPCG